MKDFILHCLSDEEFWMRGGIPTNEKKYIESLGMTEEQISRFYSAMIDLQQLAKELQK